MQKLLKLKRTWSSSVRIYLTDDDHGKYITTLEFNTLADDAF